MEQKRISYRKLPYTSQENVALYTTNQKFGLFNYYYYYYFTWSELYYYYLRFFLTLYSSKKPEKIYHGFHKNIKQYSCFEHWQ